MAQKKLTKKTLMKSFHHWYYGNLDLLLTRAHANIWLPDFYASNRGRIV
jgi:hypothetical protein